MIRYIHGHDLHQHPALRDSMFRDRAWQFKTRQNWDVTVDDQGFERDSYDDENPLYVIWDQGGRHAGSMRLLPTTGPTMVNDHFAQLMGGGTVTSPLIWECTRFCLGPKAGPGVAAALMLAGGEVLRGFALTHFIGVFDARMVRIYRAIGASPEVLGSAGQGRDKISVGLWDFTPEAQARVAARAGISPALSKRWFDTAFDVARQAQTA